MYQLTSVVALNSSVRVVSGNLLGCSDRAQCKNLHKVWISFTHVVMQCLHEWESKANAYTQSS